MNALTTTRFELTTAKVASWRHPLLLTHAKPDGDALGSLVAMSRISERSGADPLAILFDDLPRRYDFFRRYARWPVWGRDVTADGLRGVDAVVLLDTCTYSQLEPIADWLKATDVPKLAVDHHLSRDDLVDHDLIDESAAATCLILYEWARAMKWTLASDTCEALFIGIAMDTGWFIHANTDARVFRAADALATLGANPHELYQRLFLCETPQRVRLLGAALRTLELVTEDRIAVITLSQKAISDSGASPADTEDIINEPLRIGSVVVSLLLVESEEGLVRVSFRSKPPVDDGTLSQSGTARLSRSAGVALTSRPGGDGNPDVSDARETTPDVNVALAAQAFGGGGHKRAAGARVRGDLDGVRARVLQHLQSQFFDE